MTGRRAIVRLSLALSLLMTPLSLSAEEPFRIALPTAAIARDLSLDADSVATWRDGDIQWFRLQGKALLRQGTTEIKARNVLVRVDLSQKKTTGNYAISLLAEGDPLIRSGGRSWTVSPVVVTLGSRGELHAHAHPGPIRHEAPTDAFTTQARALLSPTAIPTPTTVSSPTTITDAAVQPAAATQPSRGPTPPQTALPDRPVVLPPSQYPPTPDPTADPRPPQRPALPPVPEPPPTTPSKPKTAASTTQSTRVSAPPQPTLRIAPRTAGDIRDVRGIPLPNGEVAVVATGGIILMVRDPRTGQTLDIEADRLVLYTRGDSRQMFDQMRNGSSQPTGNRKPEFYLSGNVELRTRQDKEERVLRADRVFYDVERQTAIAIQADLEIRDDRLPDPLHFKADELFQLNSDQYQAVRADIYSSKLPNDPGLRITLNDATLDRLPAEPMTTIFGTVATDPVTGKDIVERDLLIKGRGTRVLLEDVPIFYAPYFQADARDPLGPLESLGLRQDRIFGTQVYVTWSLYDLIGLKPPPNHRWMLETDYLSERGPALGTDYAYEKKDLFGIPGLAVGLFKAYGIYDDGTDILGGNRGEFDDHPLYRGRILFRHMQDLPAGWVWQSQLALLSDTNFLEQFYKYEYDLYPNQDSYIYLKNQEGVFGVTGLVQPKLGRNWYTQDEWLPRVNGYWLGQSFFDRFTYNARGQAGYGLLRPASDPFAPPYLPTDVRVDTGRFDLFQDLSLPFSLGPFRFVPYGVLDLTSYTEAINGDPRGRWYGGGGLRTSLPLSRLYTGVSSDLFNVNGIHHKIVLSGNYFGAHTDTPYFLLPQLDRLNDDATDKALRDITPRQPVLNPGFDATSLLYDPQTYAIRRLVDNRVDTLDSIQVIQADVRQRWQTKRGYPGAEHIVDFFVLDLSGSFFPNPDDNFGNSVAFLEYDATWNVGDRTALTSSGWVDPFEGGVSYWTVGAFYNRTDRTQYFLGYRQIDLLQSRALTGAFTYIFSPKYAATASGTYDFGINENMATSLVMSRIGTDLTISLGVTYNAIINNFGVIFEVVPNLAGNRVTGRGNALAGGQITPMGGRGFSSGPGRGLR